MELTKNQMLRITRIGQGLTLEEVAKKVFLSTSHISLMETDKRKIPNFVESILDFDQGIRWYQTTVAALSKEAFSEDDANEALKVLGKILRF